jgi:hypothetical protein
LVGSESGPVEQPARELALSGDIPRTSAIIAVPLTVPSLMEGRSSSSLCVRFRFVSFRFVSSLFPQLYSYILSTFDTARRILVL